MYGYSICLRHLIASVYAAQRRRRARAALARSVRRTPVRVPAVGPLGPPAFHLSVGTSRPKASVSRDVHSGCRAPRDAVRVRSADHARAPGHPPASRAPLSHADPLVPARSAPPQNHFLNWQQDPQAELARARPPSRRPHRSPRRSPSIWWRSSRSSIPSTSSSNPRPSAIPSRTTRPWHGELAPYLVGGSAGRAGSRAYLADDRSDRTPHHAVHLRSQRGVAAATSATSSAWTPACRRRTKPSRSGRDPVVTRRGSSCNCCAASDSRRDSPRGISSSSSPDVASLDGPSGATHDFTDLHAWCEVYLPGAGWVGLDPDLGALRR